MALIKRLISKERYNLKCPYSMIPKGICIHNTANDASASNEISYMQNNSNSTSFHIAIDDKESILGIPLDRNTYHAGDGINGEGNRNYISIEICYSKSGGERFNKSEKRAAKEVAELLKKYGWSINKVKRHKDFNGKYCPHRTLDMGWERFLNIIKDELKKLSSTNNELYRVRKSWEDISSQIGAFSNFDNAKACADSNNGYRVFNSIGVKVYPEINNIIIGSKVKIIGSFYATGEAIPNWVKENVYTISEIYSNKVLLEEILSWVYIKDLKLI